MRTNDRAAWAHAAARAGSRSDRRMLSLTLSLVLALSLLPGMALAAGEGVAIKDTNFPDKNFRTYISKVYDENNNDILDANEIAAVTELTFVDPDNSSVRMANIASLKGIEYFTALTTLDCSEQKLTTLDVSANTNLTTLNCSENRLTSLDLSKNTALTTLNCSYNKLAALDVSKNTNLKDLICSENKLGRLNVSANTALTRLTCNDNQLIALLLGQNTALTTLACDSNRLTSLDVRGNTNLTKLYCGSNQLRTLDLSKNTQLTSLLCAKNQLTSLDLSATKVTKYESFDTNNNQYTLGLKGDDNTFELSELTKFGFDVTEASNWRNGTVKGTTLTVESGAETVFYRYNCGNSLTADFQLKVHSDPVRAIELSSTGTVTFDDLKVGYSTVTVKDFIIRNTGNMSTGELKVMLEGTNGTAANAFQLSCENGTVVDDGILLPSIQVGGTVPTVKYQPADKLPAGTYTATVTVKSADDNGKEISESFNISLTVKDPTSAGFTLSKTTYAFPALQYGYTAVSPFAVTVTNTGSQATGTLRVECSNESAFEVTPASISSISENKTATFQVRPKLGLPVGSHSGTVTVTNGTESQSFHVSLEVTAAEKVKTPVITPSGGSFTEPQTVTITCGTEDASIFYTTDGSDVNVKNTPYTGSFTVSETTTIKAKATKANMENSDTVTVIITISSGGGTGGGGTTPTQPAAPKLPFTDVSEDDWFYADAAYLYEKGVMKGTADETFAPSRSVTRGQLAAALYRMAGEPAVTAKAAFTDVPADYWCAAAITWAAENGVVTGYGGGGFRPADAVRRQELAAMLFRFAVYQGMSAVTLEENLAPFADRADVAAYAVPAMNWAVGQGILQGKDGSLLPQAPVDRAQLAAMLRRYLEK